jgi:hypothetical protein
MLSSKASAPASSRRDAYRTQPPRDTPFRLAITGTDRTCLAWVTSDRYAAGPAPYPAWAGWPARASAPVAPVARSASTCSLSSARSSSNSDGRTTAPTPAASSRRSPSRVPVSGEDEATSGLRSSRPR